MNRVQSKNENNKTDDDTNYITKSNSQFLSMKKSQSKLQLMKQLHPIIDIENEIILDDYYCSIHKEIVINGRVRVCLKHIWFYSNIFGMETSAVLKWSDIISITRQKSALIIPNAIQILTSNEKMFLSAFVSRDKTYLLLHQLWHFSLNNKEAILPDKFHKILMESGLFNDNLKNTGSSITDSENVHIRKTNKLNIDTSQSCPSNIMRVDQLTNINTEPESNDKTTMMNKDKGDARLRYSQSTFSSTNNDDINNEHQQELVDCIGPKTRLQSSNVLRSKSTVKTGLNIFKRNKKSKKSKKHSITNVTMDMYDESVPDATSTDYSSNNINHSSGDVPSLSSNLGNTIDDDNTKIDDTNRTISVDTNSLSSEADTTNECDCSYLSNHITQQSIDIEYKTLFDYIFSPYSDVITEFIKVKKLMKYHHEDMPGGSDNEFVRKTMYSIPLHWCGRAIDTITMNNISLKKNHIQVSCESVTKGVPFGNAFITYVHYCIKSSGDNCSVVNVSFEIKYTQNVWIVTRKIIDREVKYNVNDFIQRLLQIVKSRIDRASSSSDPQIRLDHLNITNHSNNDSGPIIPSHSRKISSTLHHDSNVTNSDHQRKPAIGTIVDTDVESSQPINFITECLGGNINFIYNLNISHVVSFIILLYLVLIFNLLTNINSNVNRFLISYIENCSNGLMNQKSNL